MSFAKEKHVRYWRMCSLGLPQAYTGNDSSRMSLGFFTVSALDLLGALDPIDSDERQSWISWIYSCQTPEGGFRGFTGTDLRTSRSIVNSHWDPANIPATFFALATLLILGDDFSQVKRAECLAWLPKLQRSDGSFGELLSVNGLIEGGRDLRQCSCAAGIAYMLGAKDMPRAPFNISNLVNYVRTSQDETGGFGVSPLREPHSGLSYCGIATLAFIQRLTGQHSSDAFKQIPMPEKFVRWHLDRQTHIIDSADDEEEEYTNRETSPDADLRLGGNAPFPSSDVHIAGFNGRDGKIADTCYAFWNAGALAIVDQAALIDVNAMRCYLLEVTQHRVGGFGKSRGDPPDILHSYLGLAALALYDEPGIKQLDATMCISVDAVARLDHIAWKAVELQ